MTKFYGDYKTILNNEINALYERLDVEGYEIMSQVLRIKLVKELTDTYVKETGERPSPAALDRLSTFILKEAKKAAKGEKMNDGGEYPFHSDRQYESRIRNEAAFIDAEDHYDSTGIKRKTQTRQTRISDELRMKRVK